VWLPPRGETAGAAKVNAQKAIAKGLTFRPIAVTAKDTLEWFKSEPDERRSKLKAGISPEREAEVLAAWKESHTSK
jgi:2'-hydroxyisoflavone reductase